MIKHALPLVFFTVLAQMSVGAFLVLKITRWITPSVFMQPNSARRVLLMILILALLALFVSFTHLGSPKNAVYALCNFKSSWLSREIFFMSAFVGILLLETVFFRWINNSSFLMTVVSFIGILVAVAFIFSMAKLYQLKTVPAWDTKYTLLNFYNTALLSGVFLLILINSIKTEIPGNTLSLVCLIFLIFQVVFLLGFSSAHGNGKILVLILYGIVLILLLLQIIQILQGSTGFRIFLFLVLLAGIFIERYLFYCAYNNVGV